MNRRQLLKSSIATVGVLLATNRNALARLQEQATPTGDANAKVDFELSKLSQAESMYLGILLTLLELLDASLDDLLPAIDAFMDNGESIDNKALMLKPLGLWSYLATDAQKYDAPATFSIVHGHAINAFTSLGAAANPCRWRDRRQPDGYSDGHGGGSFGNRAHPAPSGGTTI